MAIDLNSIRFDYDDLVAAMAAKKYKEAYALCKTIMDTYQNSDSDRLWMVDDEVDEVYEIAEELETKYSHLIK